MKTLWAWIRTFFGASALPPPPRVCSWCRRPLGENDNRLCEQCAWDDLVT